MVICDHANVDYCKPECVHLKPHKAITYRLLHTNCKHPEFCEYANEEVHCVEYYEEIA